MNSPKTRTLLFLVNILGFLALGLLACGPASPSNPPGLLPQPLPSQSLEPGVPPEQPDCAPAASADYANATQQKTVIPEEPVPAPDMIAIESVIIHPYLPEPYPGDSANIPDAEEMERRLNAANPSLPGPESFGGDPEPAPPGSKSDVKDNPASIPVPQESAYKNAELLPAPCP